MNKTKIKTLIVGDGLLKIFSIILAILAWLFITTLVSPDVTITVHDVPISIDLAGTVAGSNRLMISAMTDNKVNVQVTGKSYIVNALKPSDINVTMDLAGITSAGTVEVDLRIEKSDFSNPNYQIDAWTPSRIKVTFEKLEDKTFIVQSSIPNVWAEEGLLLGTPVATPAEITVTGSQAEINRIVSCTLHTDQQKTLKDSHTFSADLRFYDANGIEVPSTNLIYQAEEYRIDVPVYQQITLPLAFKYVNVPDGVDPTKLMYSQNQQTITVGIPVDYLDPPEELQMGTIDFRTIDLGHRVQFPIKLPSGWQEIEVPETVLIEFLEDGLDSVMLSSENIVEKNAPAEYTIQLLTKKLNHIKVVGQSNAIEQISNKDLIITIDYSEVKLGPGDQQIPVSIAVSGNMQAWVVGTDYTLTVRVKERTGS